MSECVKCGNALAKTEESIDVCYPCEKKMTAREKVELLGGKLSESELSAEDSRMLAAVIRMKEEEDQEKKEAIILTTEMYPMGLDIKGRLSIITAECVFGMNIFRDFFAGVRDFFGGRSKATQKVFRDARKVVLDELREEAFEVGGNAVIGVNIQSTNLLDGKSGSMLMVATTGTVVVISKETVKRIE